MLASEPRRKTSAKASAYSYKIPAVVGKFVTFVATDVEGSTELWEWNRNAMTLATETHDRLIRSQLSRFHGYEIVTEGDSFLLAFHDPADAIAWAITIQQVGCCSWHWVLNLSGMLKCPSCRS